MNYLHKDFIYFIVILCCTWCRANKGIVNYDGYQIHNIDIRNKAEVDLLKSLANKTGLDFSSAIRVGHIAAVIAAPQQTAAFKEWLAENGFKSTITIEDIGRVVRAEIKSWDYSSLVTSSSMDWSDYHSGEVINEWLEKMAKECDFCEIEFIGTSLEGQEMKVLKVCRGDCSSKPAIWIDSGIHSREWISPAVGTWVFNELVTNHENHPQLTDNLAWYFLPLVNPDGYRETRIGDRNHRKTKSKRPGENCTGINQQEGTDANRNWDYNWGQSGSSPDSCDETYPGPKPFSEVETQNMRDFILKQNKNQHIKLYLSLHSAGQEILLPYGDSKKPPPGYDAMLKLGKKGAQAMEAVHGEAYEVGCILCIHERPASGSSMDWALVKAGIPYSYTLELRDKGAYRHFLPKEQIIPNAEEVWPFIALAAEQIAMQFGEGQ